MFKLLSALVGAALIGGLVTPVAQADDDAVLWPTSEFDFYSQYEDVLGLHLPTADNGIDIRGQLPDSSGLPYPEYGYDFQIEDSANLLVLDVNVEAWQWQSEAGTSFELPENTLTLGNTYQFRFRSTSGSQADQWSTWRSFDVVGLAPAPVLVSPADGASVTAETVSAQIPDFDASDYDGINNVPAINFRFERDWTSDSPVVSESWWVPVDENGVATAYIPVGTNGGEFRWQAMWSGQGLSEWSEPRTVTVGFLPPSPQNVHAEQQGSSISLSWLRTWDSPYKDASENVVVVEPGGISVTIPRNEAVSTVLENLAVGSYVATVTPRNAFGSGTPASVAFDVVPVQPSAPQAVEIVVNGTSVDVTWQAPAADGQSPVTGYVVTLGWGPDGPVTLVLGPEATSATFTGLAPGSGYRIEVLAENAVGAGAIATNWFTAYGPPDAPTEVETRIGDEFLDVFWSPPASSNGAEVTSYTITMMPGGVQQTVSSTWGRQGARFSELVNGTAYTFSVSATNLGGTGGASLPSAALAPISGGTDTDGDGVADVLELRAGSSILLADTDGDGLDDAVEIFQLAGFTASSVADTDGDGNNDGFADSDQDGLSNADEIVLGTNPSAPDSDHDGISDPDETVGGTDPLMADSDGDSLDDGFELDYSLDATLADTDGNGTGDALEQLSVTLVDQSDNLVTSNPSGNDPPPAELAIPTATAAINGTASDVAEFSVVENPPADLAGALTSVASVQQRAPQEGEESGGPVARTTQNATTGAASLTLGYSVHVASARLSELAPVAWNDETGSWDFVNNNVSVSTATRTITILSPTTGLRYAVVDLGRWRANATECATGPGGTPPLDVEVIIDTTQSVFESDPTGERWTALEAVISSLPAESQVYLRALTITGWSRSTANQSENSQRDLWGDANGYIPETGTWAPYVTSSTDTEFGATDKELALATIPSLVDRESYDEINLGDSEAYYGEALFGRSAFDNPEFSPSFTNPYVDNAPEIRCRARAIVLVTDGGWRPYVNGIPASQAEYFDESYVPFADRNVPVHVLDVGLSPTDTSDWLLELADDTEGTYSYVPTATDLDGWIGDVTPPETSIAVDPTLDSDADGLLDWVETAGVSSTMTRTSGRVPRLYFSDPHDVDSDDDGVSDGEEIGLRLMNGTFGIAWPSNKPITAYAVRSNPEKADSDGDGLRDFEELEVNMNPLDADADGDGLDDSEEEMNGTFAQLPDTDSDNVGDAYEVAMYVDGWDPLVFNEPVSEFEWLSDLGLGFFCGDIEICVKDSIPWLVGSIASGVAVFGDVRDAIANTIQGNYLAAAFCAAGLIPGIGDALSVAKSVGKFLMRLNPLTVLVRASAASSPLELGRKVLASKAAILLMKHDDPLVFVSRLRAVDGPLVDFFEEFSVPAYRMQELATHTSLGHLHEMAKYAVKSDVDIGAFAKGSDGETKMLELIGAQNHKQQLRTFNAVDEEGVVTQYKRFPDGEKPCTGGKKNWYESKVGLASSGAARVQVVHDLAALTDAVDGPCFAEWHFFMSSNSSTIGGTSTKLAQLAANPRASVHIHFPTI